MVNRQGGCQVQFSLVFDLSSFVAFLCQKVLQGMNMIRGRISLKSNMYASLVLQHERENGSNFLQYQTGKLTLRYQASFGSFEYSVAVLV